MRFAIMTELYPPHIGGQEVRFAELGKALSELGHEVHVHCVSHDPLLPAKEVDGQIHVYRWAFGRDYLKSRVPGARRSLTVILRYALICRRILRSQSFDAVIFNQWPIVHILAASRKQRQRSIIDWCEVREGLLWRIIQSHLPKFVLLNTGVSADVVSNIRAQSHQDVYLLPSGVDLGSYAAGPAAERRNVLYVGRIAKHKRLQLLVDAFIQMHRDGFDECLEIAGAGQAHEQLVAYVAQLPEISRSRIHLLGPVSETRKRSLLSSSRVLVIPSEREGFPRVAAEAMASGLPVVTTNDPGNGTANVVRDYKIGLVAEPTPTALASAIREVIRDHEHYEQSGMTASKSLDWASLARMFVSAINEKSSGDPL